MVAAGLGKGCYNTSSGQITLVRQSVTIGNLPDSLKGLKIGLLTDLHASFVVSPGLIESAARLIMTEQPDLIALTGDLISGATKFLSGAVGEFKKSYVTDCAEALSALKAPLGIYGVLGNHDFWSGPEALNFICDTFTRNPGVIWLRNRSVQIIRGDGAFHLLGVDDYWEGTCALVNACKGLPKESVKILLSHNPDINEEISLLPERIDLVLSGHTHGGQVVTPFIGQPFIPSKFGQKYREGLVHDGQRQTYVSRGIGHLLFPIRFNCPPEATVLTLI